MLPGTVRWAKLIGLVHSVCWNCSMGQANWACTLPLIHYLLLLQLRGSWCCIYVLLCGCIIAVYYL